MRSPTGLVLVAAVIALPAAAGAQGAADTTPPVLSNVTISLSSGLPAQSFSMYYTLSEQAVVKAKFQRKLPGRKVKKRCRKPTKKRRHKPRCTRYKTAGSIQTGGFVGPGDASLSFTGAVRNRTLKPGRYRITLTATDAAKNVSKQKYLKFKVKKF